MPRSPLAPALLFCLAAGCSGSTPAAAPQAAAKSGSSHLLPAGPFSTRGNQIVDPHGTPVRIASVGWFDYSAGPAPTLAGDVAAIKAAGFNCVRLRWVNATMAGDLQTIDKIVAAATATGIKVVLVNQTNEVGTAGDGYGAQQANGLWYDQGGASDGTNGAGVTGTVTEQGFVDDWVAVAQHYKGNPTVIGYDIRNEPLAYPGMCTWGSGGPDHDIRQMYETVGDAVLAVDPDKLIICEGPQNYSGNFAGTGPAPWGDLSLAAAVPVVLSSPAKLVYSIHDYPFEIAQFSPDNGPAKVKLMNADWGYLVTQNLAPVWIGEMGSSMQASTDKAWAQTLLSYMNGQQGAAGGPTFAAGQQGIPGDWWTWGCLPGENPDGTNNADGSLKPDQEAVWGKLIYNP